MSHMVTRVHRRGGVTGPIILWLLFSAGIICVRFLPVLPPVWLATVATALLAAVAMGHAGWRGLWVFALGLCWAASSAALLLEKGIPRDLQKQDLVATGTVTGLPRTVAHGSRFDFRIDTLSDHGRSLQSPGLVRLSSYDRAVAPQPGEQWQLVVRLKHPHGLVNPGAGFNSETWLFAQGIRAQGYIVAKESRRLAAGSTASAIDRLGLGVLALRSGFAAFIDGQVSEQRLAGILGAISVGIRSELGDDAFQVLQDTGTTHLVAISGLHIGLVSMLCGLLAGRLWRLSGAACRVAPAGSVAAGIGLLAGLGYAMLAGFTLPTRRAICMLAVVALGLLWRRRPGPLTVIAGALGVVLLTDPLAPFASSFWLSFIAVGVLVMVSSAMPRNAAAEPRGATDKLVAVMTGWSRIQIWLLLGMLPVLLAGFQQASLAAPPGNLVAVPVIGMVVVPLTLLALLCWLVGIDWLAGALIGVSEWLVDMVWRFLELLAAQPWAVWHQGLPPLWSVVLGGFGVLLLLLGRYLPGRWLGLIWMLPMLLIGPTRPAVGDFRLILLDVGQGLSVIVQTRHRFLVYDTGASYEGGFSLGRAAVSPALRHLGANVIDSLVISHGDNDHSGGAAALLEQFEAPLILTSVPDNAVTFPRTVGCHAGMQWQWDEVRFEVLWPPSAQRYTGNDSSCVIRVSSQAGSVLLPGDIERRPEYRLADLHGSDLNSDILVLPHHGSRTSSSARFLHAVSPRAALVSSGYLNRFRHPARVVRDRLAARDLPLLDTARHGALTLDFTTGGLAISSERQRRHSFWLSSSDTDLAALNTRLNRAEQSAVRGAALRVDSAVPVLQSAP